jgi:hypothetical protein
LPLVIGIVVAACAAVVLGIVFRARFFGFVDRFAGNITFASLVILFTSALIVYHTQRAQQELIHSLQVNLLEWDQVEAFLRASNVAPHVPTPVDFRYVDKERVDALYNQIEPDMPEKERTVATSGSIKGKVGVGVSGTLNAEAEAGKGVSSTSSFAHTTFSAERKCVILMNYIVDNRQPGYFTNSKGWFWGREKAALIAQIERSKTAPVDLSTIRPIQPLDDRSTDTSTEEQKREAERKAKEYNAELQNGLKSLSGFVFIDGDFDKSVNGDTLTLSETFSRKPNKVVFRLNVPKAEMPILQNVDRLRLRIFGDVISPLSGDGYVDVRPIAAY